MLTTKAFCGKCGAMVSGESGKSHTGTVHYYYKCGNHKRNGRAACDLQAVRKEPLELFVVKAAVQKVLQPKVDGPSVRFVAGLSKTGKYPASTFAKNSCRK